MKDDAKTKAQLIEELNALRSELEKLKEEKHKLWASEARYRLFVDNIGDGCYEFDLQGNIMFCNDGLPRIFGYSREEFLKLDRWKRHINREYGKYVFRLHDEMYKKNISSNILEYKILRRDAVIRDYEASVSLIRDQAGEVIGYRGIGRDITERKKMEQERERYREFVENVEDICAEYDLKGKCTFCNESGARGYGFSMEEIMQLHHHERYPSQEEAEKIFNAVHETYVKALPVNIVVANVLCKDGKIKSIETALSLIRNADGVPIGFRSVGRDVTARKMMEEEREALREQLSQARKMEAIGTLAGGVAHDFNNLLMGIQGYTSLMLLDTDLGHPHYTQLKAIESHVRSGADLTRQLLGYARGGRYEVKPVDLNEIAVSSAGMFGRTKKEIIMEQELAEDLWIVDADRGQMEQVLLNLFVNAWHAMPGGGEIFIRTKNVVLEKSHVLSLDIPPGPYVKLTVKDSGVGMDDITRERLFEPFFTTKEMGMVRGAGLGLASVYGIIKGHKGAINVQSERGKGATFNIYLPASFKDFIRETEPEKAILRGRETILLVDDEKSITDVVGEMIRGLGYRLMTAESGEDAMDVYRANPGHIDLIIMDMIMPGLGGGAAIDAIWAENPAARIILSSGYSLNGEAQDILSRGGIISFMQKPFELTELSQKIREILDK